MQLDFKTHKKSKKFPFPVLGFILSITLIGLFAYFTSHNIALINLINNLESKEHLDVFYFSFIIINTLFFLFSLSVLFQIRSSLKFFMAISLFSYSLSGILTGYFYESHLQPQLFKFYFIAALSYFVFYLLASLFQNSAFSRYQNKIVILLSSLPVIPLIVITIGVINNLEYTHKLIITSSYFYLLSLLLYALINSVYIFILNRKI